MKVTADQDNNYSTLITSFSMLVDQFQGFLENPSFYVDGHGNAKDSLHSIVQSIRDIKHTRPTLMFETLDSASSSISSFNESDLIEVTKDGDKTGLYKRVDNYLKRVGYIIVEDARNESSQYLLSQKYINNGFKEVMGFEVSEPDVEETQIQIRGTVFMSVEGKGTCSQDFVIDVFTHTESDTIASAQVIFENDPFTILPYTKESLVQPLLIQVPNVPEKRVSIITRTPTDHQNKTVKWKVIVREIIESI